MDDKPLSYKIKYEQRPRYLYARVTADNIDREMALRYLRELGDKCRAVKADRLMVERDIPATLNDAENYFVIMDMLQIFSSIRLAFINKHAAVDEGMAFGSLVWQNRGAPFNVFDNYADAERWLLK